MAHHTYSQISHLLNPEKKYSKQISEHSMILNHVTELLEYSGPMPVASYFYSGHQIMPNNPLMGIDLNLTTQQQVDTEAHCMQSMRPQ